MSSRAAWFLLLFVGSACREPVAPPFLPEREPTPTVTTASPPADTRGMPPRSFETKTLGGDPHATKGSAKGSAPGAPSAPARTDPWAPTPLYGDKNPSPPTPGTPLYGDPNPSPPR